MLISLIIALMRLSRPRLPRTVSTIYVEVARGTPCPLQLFYIYFVLPTFGIRFDPFMAGVIGLSVNYSAPARTCMLSCVSAHRSRRSLLAGRHNE